MNREFKLSALAALGLIAGSMGSAEAACKPPTAMEMRTMNTQLDDEHQDTFASMSCEAQNEAMQMAKQTCKGRNACKGMNSCKSSKNSCAGQGSCKGTAKGPFNDKDQAVDIAQKRMQANGE
jgi:hypothetical protein